MSGHIVPVRTYYMIFAALLAMTALTVSMAFVDLGRMNIVVALAIAVTKASLVILFFMHVYYGSRLTFALIAAGFFFLLLMATLTLGDVVSRGWLVKPAEPPSRVSREVASQASGAEH
jgi:cytochrome c oxidase subunit 4